MTKSVLDAHRMFDAVHHQLRNFVIGARKQDNTWHPLPQPAICTKVLNSLCVLHMVFYKKQAFFLFFP